METGYLVKPFERVFTETDAFPDMGTLTFFDRLNEFSLSFQFFLH